MIGEIYERHYARFLRVAEAIVGDHEIARDAVQDAFVRVVKSRAGFRGDGSVEGWVWRTVVNTASSARRKAAIGHASAQEQLAGLATNGHEASAGTVRALLAMLPERQRLVLFLRYYADLDYRTIADVLKIEPGTVGATLNQAHAAMRRLLEEVPT